MKENCYATPNGRMLVCKELEERFLDNWLKSIGQKAKVEVRLRNCYDERQARHGLMPKAETERRDYIYDETEERKQRINFGIIYARLGYPSGRPNNEDLFFKTC